MTRTLAVEIRVDHTRPVRAAELDEEGNELVAECAKCPTCGERRMDWLLWDADGYEVTCQTCGVVYTPW